MSAPTNSDTGTRLRSVGRSLPARSAPEVVTGSLLYLTDLHLPGMLHGKVVRAPVPHALIRSIDTRRAHRVTGVAVILTATDVPNNISGAMIADWPVLAQDRVRQVGEAIALVAAESEQAADEAARLVEVDLDQLPVVDCPEGALGPGAPVLHDAGNLLAELTHQKGDVEAALATSEVVVERIVRTPFQEHVCLEPGGGVGTYEMGRLTIYCGTQNPGVAQRDIARALDIQASDVRIVSTPMGGAFGSKGDWPVPIYLALLAWATGRPVRLALSREEVMTAGIKRHPFRIATRLGLSREGFITALDTDALVDTGAYASVGPAVLKVAAEMSTGPYRMPAARFRGRVVYTNNPTAGAFRGYGVPQVSFALETALDEAGMRLDIDPVAMRQRNVLRAGDEHGLYGHVVGKSLRPAEALDQVVTHPWWQDAAQWRASSIGPWRRGTGLALAIKGVGRGSGRVDEAGARLALDAQGSVRIWAGPNHSGQFIETAYAQIAADVLGRPWEEIEVITGDTDLVPESGPCAASRSTYAGGSAVRSACEELLARVDDLGLTEPIDWLEAGRRLRESGHALIETSFKVPDVQELGRLDEERLGHVSPHLVYGSSAQVVRLQVNERTGETVVLGVVCVVDCGVAINPAGVIGQAEGGVIQGLGYALMEDFRLDGGRPQTRSLETYLIPTIKDVPEIETFLIEEPEATGPFGAKGIAEVVLVPSAPAVAGALRDALGIDVREIPATPERVRRMSQGAFAR